MAYVRPNHATKKSLRDALAAGERVEVFQPALGSVPDDGEIALEGPHGNHRWYATGTMRDGRLVKIK